MVGATHKKSTSKYELMLSHTERAHRDARAEKFMTSALDNWKNVPSKLDHFSFIETRAFLVENLFHQVRHSCEKLACNYHCMRNSCYSRRSILGFSQMCRTGHTQKILVIDM